jgi:hypothetical protein
VKFGNQPQTIDFETILSQSNFSVDNFVDSCTARGARPRKSRLLPQCTETEQNQEIHMNQQLVEAIRFVASPPSETVAFAMQHPKCA